MQTCHKPLLNAPFLVGRHFFFLGSFTQTQDEAPDQITTALNRRYARKLSGYSLQVVARFMGIHASKLCDLEQGKEPWTWTLLSRHRRICG